MPALTPLPRHLRPRREKVFGDGRPRPLDREAKVRIMTFARALMRRIEKGKHYGAITAKAYAVLQALLWTRHNARSGLCFPSYETIADDAGCARSTVAECIKALEEAGILSWVHRIKRVGEKCARPVRQERLARPCRSHQQRLPVSRPLDRKEAGGLGFFFQVRISVWNHNSRFYFFSCAPCPTRF